MAAALGAVRALDEGVALLERLAAAALLGVAVVVVLAQVLFRHGLDSSLSWAEETARYLFVWGSMLGFSSAVHARGLFSFELVYGHLPAWARRGCRVLSALAAVAFLWALVVGGIRLAAQAVTQSSPAIGLSMAWPYAALPVGGALVSLHLLRILLDRRGAEAA